MDYDARIPVFLLSNLILVWLLQMVNGVAAGYGLFFNLGATLLLAPALFLRLRWGLVVVGLTGLFQGALLPLAPNGFFLVCYAIALMPLYLFSPELRRLKPLQTLLFALGVNTALIAAQAVALAQGRLAMPEYWLRVLADVLISALVFYPVSKWFMNFQQSIVRFFGDDLRTARANDKSRGTL